MNAEELTRKWQPVLDLAIPIWTWTEPHALAYCCEQASHAEYGVELGTYLGASAFVMLSANPRLHLWCVDLFYEIGIQKMAEYWLADFIFNGRCELIKGDSNKAASMLAPHMKGKIDYVFVDDGHLTTDVIRDIDAFKPLVKPGGWLFGHDYDDPPNDVALGVRAAIPLSQVTVPVPRVWAWQVQGGKGGCCGH